MEERAGAGEREQGRASKGSGDCSSSYGGNSGSGSYGNINGSSSNGGTGNYGGTRYGNDSSYGEQ
jgi:hypothetical protein